VRRLFLDANVLFTAAHNPGGKAALIIELGAEGHWRVFTSAYAIEETERNLTLKFPGALARHSHLMELVALVKVNPSVPFPAELSAKDRPIFQGALSCRATHLITGDLRDFGRFMNRSELTFGLVVQTAAQFLDSL
jgi:predicted nucleic acid-binding protein